MGYIIYGKRPQDAKFAPLDEDGRRTSKGEAMEYDTREDAKDVVDRKGRDGIKFEIRKA